MIITFKQDCILQVCSYYDEANDEAKFEEESFNQGEQHLVDLVCDHGNSVDIQFGDGSVAYNVPKENFE